MAGLRRIVSELMIYDAGDTLCSGMAEGFLEQHRYGAWTVDARGIRGVAELSGVLQDYLSVEQVTFSTHGMPGGVFLSGGSLTTATLPLVQISPGLYRGPGRLLFQGCQTVRTEAGRRFLVAAGRRFFAGKGGVVAGCTIFTLGLSSGARLPLIGRSSGGWEIGRLILFSLDARGNVVATRTVRPFGL